MRNASCGPLYALWYVDYLEYHYHFVLVDRGSTIQLSLTPAVLYQCLYKVIIEKVQ